MCVLYNWLGRCPVEQNIGDAHAGQGLAVARLASVAHLRLVPKHDDLLTAGVLDDLGPHDGPRDARRTHVRTAVAAARDEQHSTQVEHFARLTAEPLYGDRIAWFYAVLLPACFDNGVHRIAQFSDPWWLTAPCKKTPRAQRPRGLQSIAERRRARETPSVGLDGGQRRQLLERAQPEVLEAIRCEAQQRRA